MSRVTIGTLHNLHSFEALLLHEDLPGKMSAAAAAVQVNSPSHLQLTSANGRVLVPNDVQQPQDFMPSTSTLLWSTFIVLGLLMFNCTPSSVRR